MTDQFQQPYTPQPQQPYTAYNFPPEAGMPPAARAQTKARIPLWVWIAFVAVALVFGAAGVAIGRDTATAAAPTPPRASAAAQTFTATGLLNLSSLTGGIDFGITGDACHGQNGYDDITEGAQVVVYDAAGKTLAIGALSPGQFVARGVCQFTWAVVDIPSGVGPYSVQVTHRGMVAFTEEQAQNQQLSIGS